MGAAALAPSGDRPAWWLPQGKRAAVCFSIDDVHPGRSTDAYEAGGDLGAGALGHVEWLLERHPQLRVTLFVTADWRELSPFPTRRLTARVPILRNRVHLSRVLPKGTMRLDRHPEFTSFLQWLPRTEIGLHGLHHLHPGPRLTVEFHDRTAAECADLLGQAQAIFSAASLPPPEGMTPPSWELSTDLAEGMVERGLSYVASARDIVTDIGTSSVTAMSGLCGVALIHPELIQRDRLVHVPTNFQATSSVDRALNIIECGGLLSIKAHIIKNCFGHVALDGLDELYRNYLDVLFGELARQFGDSIWWATMGEIAAQAYEIRETRAVVGR